VSERRVASHADDPALRCPQCGAVGEFGYRDAEGVLRWFCGEHRLSASWADEHLPTPVEIEAAPVAPNVPAQSLEDLTAQFHAMVDEGRRMTHRRHVLDGKIEDMQLRCGQKLLEMRRRIEEGEVGDQAAIDWWGWYADAVPHVSRKHAERWMSIASAADPEVAALKYRDRDADYQRAYRARQKAKALPPTVAPSDRGPVRGTEPRETEPSASLAGEREEPPLATAPVIRKRAPLFAGHDIDESAEIEAALTIFRRLTWNGRIQLIKAQTKLYDEWRRGR
jgi:hypothetical protein